MQTTSHSVLVRRRRLRVALLLLERWWALRVVDACITVLRCGRLRRIGCLFVGLNDAQVLAYFSNLPFLNEDLLDGAVVRAGDLDAGLVALYLTERVEGTNRG